MAGKTDPWTSVTNATYLVLDGVPMRIPEGFRPHKRIIKQLPAGLRFNPAQSKVLDVKYSFETERGFLKWLKDSERADEEKAEEKRRNEEVKRKQQEEAKQKQLEDDRERLAAEKSPRAVDGRQTTTASTSAITNTKPVFAPPTVSNSILRPQRASPVTVTASSAGGSQSAGAVNIRDFENLAQDPFDDLELDTINDLQELESVLANSHSAATTSNSPQLNLQINEASTANGTSTAVIANPPLYENVEEVKAAAGNEVLQTPDGKESPIYENPLDVVADTLSGDEQMLKSVNTNAFTRLKAPKAFPRSSLNADAVYVNDLDKAPAECSTAKSSSRPNSGGETNASSMPAANIPVKQSTTKKPPPVKPKPMTVEKLTNSEPNDSTTSKQETVSKQETANGKTGGVQFLANALSKDLGVMYRPPGAPKGFSYTGGVVNGTSNVVKDKDVKDIEWPSFDQQSVPSTPVEETTSALPPSNPTSLEVFDPNKPSQDGNAVGKSHASQGAASNMPRSTGKPPNSSKSAGSAVAASNKPVRPSPPSVKPQRPVTSAAEPGRPLSTPNYHELSAASSKSSLPPPYSEVTSQPVAKAKPATASKHNKPGKPEKSAGSKAQKSAASKSKAQKPSESRSSSSNKIQKSSKGPNDRQVLESLTAMGFEKPQITVAMRHIGSDTKELAEHLLLVQQLVANGVRWQSAQQALIMCGPDLTKAGKFAKAYQQLTEFGFADDQIKTALISCDMDVQRALDTLVQ